MAKEIFFGEDRICAVIAARTSREMWRQLCHALRHTRTLELRLDWLENGRELQNFLVRLGRAKFSRNVALIATCRRTEAGGRFPKSVTAQLALLHRA
ncbi:MAG: type I 3-dehydroquinate dehydratase, partial [Candidatus Acidiferrales bacterium]